MGIRESLIRLISKGKCLVVLGLTMHRLNEINKDNNKLLTKMVNVMNVSLAVIFNLSE